MKCVLSLHKVLFQACNLTYPKLLITPYTHPSHSGILEYQQYGMSNFYIPLLSQATTNMSLSMPSSPRTLRFAVSIFQELIH